MQGDLDVYVDSEDEVFFGCVSDKERSIRAKFLKQAESSQSKYHAECEKLLNNYEDLNGVVENKISGVDINTSVIEVGTDALTEDDLASTNKIENESHTKNQDCSRTQTNDSAVELEHNYSTPVKHKIDKTILSTPKSIVKADKDGGFLKVLSEIALVKAEVEADKQVSDDKKDEDKENQIIPEINIINATPEKTSVLSPPKSVNKQCRKFRIIYNSPKNEDNLDKSVKTISTSHNFENCQNLKNKSSNPDTDSSLVKEMENLTNNMGFSTDFNQSINLINFDDSNILNRSKKIEELIDDGEIETIQSQLCEKQRETKNRELELTLINDIHQEESLECIDMKLIDVSECLDKNFQSDDNDKIKSNVISEQIKNDESLIEIVTSEEIVLDKLETDLEKKCEDKPQINLLEDLSNSQTHKNGAQTIIKSEKGKEPEKTQLHSTTGRRFSKEARMIVEVLKKSTAEDTLNFTIQEIDVENEENSFLSPEPVPCFDDTVLLNKDIEVPNEIKTVQRSPLKNMVAYSDIKEAKHPERMEKDKHKLTPVMCRSKIKQPAFFSCNKNGSEVKKFEKNPPVVEKNKIVTEEKNRESKICEKDLNAAPSSKIPVFGVKASKIPLGERVFPSVTTKTTPLKTPTQKIYKNPKFDKIESPISAYINNKPTSLVLNVKPTVKKNCLTKIWTGSGKKIPGKDLNAQNLKPSRLPFVEYRSATPYKVEKRPESKLPQLTPTLKKLIGTHSPRVLKHEGRFYVKTPRRAGAGDDCTIVADSKEVSVLVSQTAQKSNTIK